MALLPGVLDPITIAEARIPATWPWLALAMLVPTNAPGDGDKPMRSGDCRAPTKTEFATMPETGSELPPAVTWDVDRPAYRLLAGAYVK